MKDKFFFKSCNIVDPGSSHSGGKFDIFVENGVITDIVAPGRKSVSADEWETIDCEGSCISPGWFDMRVSFRDPGFEFKEDLLTGSRAAAMGGFTGVACLPNTYPVIHSKGEVEYIINKSRDYITEVHPLGAITQNREGKEISEMYDMHLAGAVAFSDGNKPVSHTGVLLKALMYTKGFGGLIITHAEDVSLSSKGQMHEGTVSTGLGLKGIPAIAEYLQVIRDIELARYAGSPIHFSHISTARSVEIIREAKSQGFPVTADVAICQLALSHENLTDYDTNYKVNPPLRAQSDIDALKEGLKDGTIDAIVSDHSPEDVESKNVEFDFSAFGMIGLQTLFPLALEHLDGVLSIEEIVTKISINPRKILKLEVPCIEVGGKANFTVFNTGKTWNFNKKNNQSRSMNSPFLGKDLKGLPWAVFNKNKLMVTEPSA